MKTETTLYVPHHDQVEHQRVILDVLQPLREDDRLGVAEDRAVALRPALEPAGQSVVVLGDGVHRLFQRGPAAAVFVALPNVVDEQHTALRSLKHLRHGLVPPDGVWD
jgi:hypothetical protein